MNTIYGNVPFGSVTLTNEYMKNAARLESEYLMELDADRLLAGFRENAWLDTNGKERYASWESMRIGGHTMGHYLTACAQTIAYAGTPASVKKSLTEKLDYIFDALIECQENSKGKPGFLFGATFADKNDVERQFDTIASGKMDDTWVPWYTLHKIIDGLVIAYELTGAEKAKKIASAIGDWTYNRISVYTEEEHQNTLRVEFGGMNDCLYKLYCITGDEKHEKAAHFFEHERLYERIMGDGVNILTGLHANTTIPKLVGAVNRYMTVGGDEYLAYSKRFFDLVTDIHTYVNGGNSEWEHFREDGSLDAKRTNCNCETCNVYNMLKLSRELFRCTGDRKYIDYYERAFINQILSSQNPETGMTTYFQPMATGYFKTYSDRFTSFWCCTGSGMESMSKLHDSIYYLRDDEIIVNMYFSSKLTLDGVTLTQTVDDTDGIKAAFTVKSKAPVKIRLRVPEWSSGVVTFDGKPADVAPDGYIDVTAKGSFTVYIPCRVQAEGLPDNPNVFAFKYGPYVLSAALGRHEMTTSKTGVDVTIPKCKHCKSEHIELPDGLTPAEFAANADKYLHKKKGELKFTLTIGHRRLTFAPHYLKYDERYGIYWYFD